MNLTTAKRKERQLLAKLSCAIERKDAEADEPGEVALIRWELRQFYRSLGLHP